MITLDSQTQADVDAYRATLPTLPATLPAAGFTGFTFFSNERTTTGKTMTVPNFLRDMRHWTESDDRTRHECAVVAADIVREADYTDHYTDHSVFESWDRETTMNEHPLGFFLGLRNAIVLIQAGALLVFVVAVILWGFCHTFAAISPAGPVSGQPSSAVAK